MDDDFSDLFDDLDTPTESAKPARASKLDRVEIEDSEGLRAIVEAELETELFETDDFGTTVEGEIVISYDAASGQDVIDAARRANDMSSLRSDDPDWTSRFDAIVAESGRIARLEDLRVGILQLRATAETVESERLVENDIVVAYDAASGRDIIDAAHEAYRLQASSLRSYDPNWQTAFDALSIESDRLSRLDDISIGLCNLAVKASQDEYNDHIEAIA